MLFKSSDIVIEDLTNKNRKVTKAATGLKVFNPEGWKHLRKKVGSLERARYHHFTTDGHWSAIHLLEFVLEQCGPADVWMTTWSISENAIRRMVSLHSEQSIKSLNALFDRRVKIYNTNAYHFAERHFKIKLMPVHAKVTVIKGERMTAVINQSANYNENKRLESGIISTVAGDADYYIEWIENHLHGGSTEGS